MIMFIFNRLNAGKTLLVEASRLGELANSYEQQLQSLDCLSADGIELRQTRDRLQV